MSNPEVTIIGGGSGTAAIYGDIAEHTKNVTAILGVFDSGGSTGRLSEELDIPPVGDFRNVMMASSQNPAVRRMQRQRFDDGESLRGHSAGNIMIAACIAELGFEEGLEEACAILQVPGKILPVTLDRADLVLQDGKEKIVGEHQIDVYSPISKEPRVSLTPEVKINPRAEDAIDKSDLVVIPGGSIYTSLLAVLSVNGVREALANTKAPKVMLCNLATEQHQTVGWHVSDYVLALKRHGIDIDVVLYNNEVPTAEMLKNYKSDGEQPVDCSPEKFKLLKNVELIGAALLSDDIIIQNPNDPLKRGLMRHDAVAVRQQLWKILDN